MESTTDSLSEIYEVLYALTDDEFYISDDATAFYTGEIESINSRIDEIKVLMIAASIADFETRLSTSDSSNNLSLLSDISDFMGENILEDADATRLEDC